MEERAGREGGEWPFNLQTMKEKEKDWECDKREVNAVIQRQCSFLYAINRKDFICITSTVNGGGCYPTFFTLIV